MRMKQERVLAGLCAECGQTAEPERTLCMRHANIAAKSRKTRRARKLEVGECVDCPNLQEPNKTRCKRCAKVKADETRLRNRRKRANWKKRGLCVDCGLRRPEVSMKTCRICLARRAVRRRNNAEVKKYEAAESKA